MEKEARSEEERTTAVELDARARAEQQLQKACAELERLRLKAEAVLPSQAEQKAQELKARGRAVATAEDVKASALVNDLHPRCGRRPAARRVGVSAPADRDAAAGHTPAASRSSSVSLP